MPEKSPLVRIKIMCDEVKADAIVIAADRDQEEAVRLLSEFSYMRKIADNVQDKSDPEFPEAIAYMEATERTLKSVLAWAIHD